VFVKSQDLAETSSTQTRCETIDEVPNEETIKQGGKCYYATVSCDTFIAAADIDQGDSVSVTPTFDDDKSYISFGDEDKVSSVRDEFCQLVSCQTIAQIQLVSLKQFTDNHGRVRQLIHKFEHFQQRQRHRNISKTCNMVCA
jgi:hypothetical protein